MAAPLKRIFTSKYSLISRLTRDRIALRTICTSNSLYSNHGDIRKLFIDSEVQSILRKITGYDLMRINAPQLQEDRESKVELLTDDDLQKAQKEAWKKAEEFMLMPPVMDPREEIDELLSDDPEIAEAVNGRFVFSDVTYGVPDRDRIIVVRETDGKLRSATWSERERMQQIYFPLEGRKLRMPRMFLDENLHLVLDEERYVYALERACLQFEPDDPHFIRVTNTVYDHVCDNKQFDAIRSTRHFGPMAFYFARRRNIDQLLIYFLNRNELDCAADTVRLLHILNPGMKSAVSAKEKVTSEPQILLELYCELDAVEKGPISLLLQSQLESQAEG